MTKNKQLLLLAVVFITAITVGFFSISNDGNPTSTTAPNTNSPAINTNNLPDALVGAWTNGAPVTTQVYFGGSDSYQRNDTGWVFTVGGNAPSAASGVTQRYNVNTNTYTTLAVLPYTTVVNGCAVLKDSLYTMGGYLGGSAPTTNFYKYDINANTWSAKAPMPGAAAFCKGVGYQDSLIYVARGYDGSAVSGTIYLYNSNTNTWRTATSMPGSRFGGAFSRSGDTLVYVGGADLSVFYNTTYRGVISQSDRSVITWTTGAVCPGIGAGMYRMDLRPWGCKGLILTGGSTGAAFTLTSNICYTYSPGSNTWTAQANKTTAWTCGQSGSIRLPGNIWKLACVSGYNGTGTIAGTEIFTDTLCPSSSNATLVLVHDSVNASSIAKRKADRDSLRAHLTGLVGGYDLVTFDTNSALPSLTGYSRIIVQETSFDAIGCRWLGLAARNNLTAWLNSGTPSNRKTLIIMGGDLGYNYSRANAGQDLNFAGQILGIVYRLDNADPSPGTLVGERIDGGNSRNITSPVDAGYYPDGCGFSNGSYPLYRWVNQTNLDTLAAIGRYTTGYEVRSMFADPRYFTGGSLLPTLTALINGPLTGVNPINNEIPMVYSLSQNYPNPFNPVTNIKFSIPAAGNVKLVLFDILGREVKTLINDVKPAGNYVVDFNASELSSGAYFYRLESGNFVETKKMLLVK